MVDHRAQLVLQFLGARLLSFARFALDEVVYVFLGTERFHHAGDRQVL